MPDKKRPVPAGGKVPPSVIKQHQMQQQKLKAQTKKAPPSKPTKSTVAPSKTIAARKQQQQQSTDSDSSSLPPPPPGNWRPLSKESKKYQRDHVKKTFEEDSGPYGTESSDEESRKTGVKKKKTATSENFKSMIKEEDSGPGSNSDDEEPAKQKEKETKKTSTVKKAATTTSGRGRGRPRKYPLPSTAPPKPKIAAEKPKSETKKTSAAVSSASSTSTGSSTSTSSNSDSDSDNANDAKPSRKSQRRNRKSKHISGKTDSETDDSTAVKKPVKKIPSLIPTKGTSKQKKIEQKHNLNLSKDSQPEEKGCRVEGCNSMGHLGGTASDHYTYEACPKYHNLTNTETKQNLIERKKRMEERAKAQKEYEPKKPQTAEQKAYLQKIRDLRAKFKPTKPVDDSKSFMDDREPNLNGCVSDYDLQLFRDAQAIGSENIENELNAVSDNGLCGTKYVVMGKNNMQVWYQSVYPEDVQRLPKLYLCEFCLRYQKCELGMKRHAQKCVWRHPPGDEIYRKNKLSVWQVDGKRHKNYCQHLCLLAKFFLDHKTLYFDVDPFLFYIMSKCCDVTMMLVRSLFFFLPSFISPSTLSLFSYS